jgi:RNA polymerase sigma-70 factor (ECF subfamily)
VTLVAFDYAALSDAELAELVRRRDVGATRRLLTANNQRLFRAAWSILLDKSEAEEAVQEAYMKAIAALPGFRGEASLSTWLTRIVVNEALERKRRRTRRTRQLEAEGVTFIDGYREALMRGSTPADPSPEQAIMRAELARVLERAIALLPAPFRATFVLREIEGLSVPDVAAALTITEATVRTRLHRARERLRTALEPELTGVTAALLPFAGLDCEGLTARVLARLGLT